MTTLDLSSFDLDRNGVAERLMEAQAAADDSGGDLVDDLVVSAATLERIKSSHGLGDAGDSLESLKPHSKFLGVPIRVG